MKRPRILVVDDDEGTLQAIAATLRHGFAVWVARDAAGAVEVARELDWDADALVVDLNLGDGPRGDEFAAGYAVFARRKTPVLVISGTAAPFELVEGLDCSAILHKPFDFERLPQLVSMLVAARAN